MDKCECEKILKALVFKYIANIGTKDNFVVCITPKKIPIYWEKAIKYFGYKVYQKDKEDDKE